MDEPFHGRRIKNHFPVVLEAEVWRGGTVAALKQVEEENRKLKQLVADLSLDKHILQEVVQKEL